MASALHRKRAHLTSLKTAITRMKVDSVIEMRGTDRNDSGGEVIDLFWLTLPGNRGLFGEIAADQQRFVFDVGNIMSQHCY